MSVHVGSKVVIRYEVWCDECLAKFAEFSTSQEAHERAALHYRGHLEEASTE